MMFSEYIWKKVHENNLIEFERLHNIKVYPKPVKGCSIYASRENPHHKPGDFLGKVIQVDGNIVTFEYSGKTDQLIWKFKDGFNRHHFFGA